MFLKEPFSFCLPVSASVPASASVLNFFYFSSRRMTSNFRISPPKLQFLPTPPVWAPCFFLSSFPSKVLPVLCFETLKVARLLRRLLIHTNDCPFIWCQWERRKNKQTRKRQQKRVKEEVQRTNWVELVALLPERENIVSSLNYPITLEGKQGERGHICFSSEVIRLVH